MPINGTETDDTLWGTTGNDEINGLGGNDSLFATSSDDPNFTAAGQTDTLNGGAGNDTLYLLGANGVADGGEGDDRVVLDYYELATPVRYDHSGTSATVSGPATVTIRNVENATVFGGIGSDTLSGANGRDEFFGSDGADILNGRGGNDRLSGDSGDDLLFGGSGADDLDGGDENDWLDGGSGADTLEGGDGDDVIVSLDGADRIDGEDGVDTAAIARVFSWSGSTVDISDPSVVQTLADGTTLVGIERLDIAGGFGADRFTGGALSDILVGGGGDDRLTGGGGDDILSGLFGNDRIEGGAGRDTAVFVGRRDDYRITRLDDGSYRVEGRRGFGDWDDTDVVSGVEVFRFSDGDWIVG